MNESEEHLYLVDAFRTPLAQLFELNDYLKNFRTNKHKSLIDDLCVHVGEISRLKSDNTNQQNTQQKIKTYLPEFNCLYLSPTNFWSNDYNSFINDDDIIQTINNSPNYFKNLGLNHDTHQNNYDMKLKLINMFKTLIKKVKSNNILDEETSTDLSELLFGVSWDSVITSLKDDERLEKKVKNFKISNKSIVFTYSITIALKNYDKSFIDELKEKLENKFNLNKNNNLVDANDSKEDEIIKNTIFNLQYTSQSIVYYIPYFVLYFLLFMYIYISVRKIEFVKSKWGLAFAAVSQVIVSLFMSIGICSYFGLTPTLNGGEIFPYLIIFIGFENIVVLTKSVVSTPFDLDVRYRIALGLKKESWLITKILIFELIIIFFGILTMVPAIQEFCVFACVGLIIDFFMQMIFFVTVLSIDIRRMELTDLGSHNQINSNNLLDNNETNNRVHLNENQLTRRGNKMHYQSNNHNHKYTKIDKNAKDYANLLINKSVQFFYFWAKTRMVQRCVMILSVLWILLIFYKSLLVVELMRHDVNISKETVDALLPKGSGLPKLIQDNFQQYIFTSTKTNEHKQKQTDNLIQYKSSSNSIVSTVDYIKRNFKNLISIDSDKKKEKLVNNNNNYNDKYQILKSKQITGQNWRSLDYYHWLSLFANYNVSLYNRYVAILPEIEIHRVINQNDILKHRNLNEIKQYNPIWPLNHLQVNNSNNLFEQETSENFKVEDNVLFRWALFELIGIVVLGIPTIYFIVYLLTLFYKCLCSKKYEQWRKSWSTANIKRQYKKIHSRANIKNCVICDNTGFKAKIECHTCKYENSDSNNSYSSFDSDYESEKMKSVNRKFSYSEASEFELEARKSFGKSKSMDQNDLLKIINGQQDDIELKPIKIFNSENLVFYILLLIKYN
jgi:hypothetical protein